jgi:hypothetical protein
MRIDFLRVEAFLSIAELREPAVGRSLLIACAANDARAVAL